ncbi:tRNA1(Val) (adenine(37)-N6)-methyltransferase [Porphyromonas sp.]|uniref:tRNA1(Val) (adenine(37)-N6)-methyltransferase n=1 Tax=Porphyromonas sp. TaxID=1924944 RepID=UPI0026DB6C22|nr:methyltransferase [Porphyromonas sp.]MDO4695285.1 methyltransferase [Porphyromonas sp.]MDO4770677.1 methyltransferase [Porphyromonas sp.]
MRRYEPFMFKHFKVHQQESAMKVGTDAVLLGAYVTLPSDEPVRVLDVGSGTGIVGMMIAQRAPFAQVDCVEISHEAVEESGRSVEESPFADRIRVFCSDFSDFSGSEKYHLIVSNPPFFTETHKAKGRLRNQARHMEGLTPEVFFDGVRRLLISSGRVTIITAVSSFERFCKAASAEGYFLAEVLLVRPTKNADVKRIVATWSRIETDRIKFDDLFIEVSRHRYSEAFKAMTGDFYLDKK